MAIRSKIRFISLLLFWPALCLGADDNGRCVSSSRELLSPKDFAYIAGDYIDERGIAYSPHARTRMIEQRVSETAIERILRYPHGVQARLDGINKYNITGPTNNDGSFLRLGVSLEPQEPQRQLKVFAVIHTLQKSRIPLLKEDFIPFISDYLGREKLEFSLYSRQRMGEQSVTESDIEYVLRNPMEMGNKTTMRNYTSDSKIYVRGITDDGKELNLGLASRGEKFIVVTSVNRILNDQIPLLKEGFIRFTRDYLGAKKRIIYTQHARERMGQMAIGEDDIEHTLKHPFKITYRSNHKGYYVRGQTINGRPYRLMFSFDGRIVVFSMDAGQLL